MDKYGWLYDPGTQEIPGVGKTYPVLRTCDLLRKQREILGLSQKQVASAARITLRQYQRFELGERDLQSSSMRIGVNVCYALGVDPLYFCDLDAKRLAPEPSEEAVL